MRIGAHLCDYRVPGWRSPTPATQHSFSALQYHLQLALRPQTNEGEEFRVTRRNSRQEYFHSFPHVLPHFLLQTGIALFLVHRYGNIALTHTHTQPHLGVKKKKKNHVGTSIQVPQVCQRAQLIAPEAQGLCWKYEM